MRERRAGLDISWITRGSGPRPALFIHCTLASARSMVPVMDDLVNVLSMAAFDLPGHGESGRWDGEGDYLTRSVEVAETFCEGPRDIVGHSFGAVVALSLMVRRPDLVRRAVLIEPVFFAAAKGTEALARHESEHARIRTALEAGDRRAATEAFTDIWGLGQPWPAIPPRQRQSMAERIHLVEAAAPGLRDDSTGILDEGRLGGLRAPILLLRGEDTHPVIAEVFRTLLSLLPNAEEEIVPQAGHMVPMTRPNDVSWWIHEHMRRRYE